MILTAAELLFWQEVTGEGLPVCLSPQQTLAVPETWLSSNLVPISKIMFPLNNLSPTSFEAGVFYF